MAYKCDECGQTSEEKKGCCGSEMTEEKDETRDEESLEKEFENE